MDLATNCAVQASSVRKWRFVGDFSRVAIGYYAFFVQHLFCLWSATPGRDQVVLSALLLIALSLSPSPFLPSAAEEDHPAVQPDEKYPDYLSRTEQYWVKLARQKMGPDAKEKKMVKVGHAMAKAFHEGEVLPAPQ